jgi:outer membrane cobalamin receptor
MKTPSRMSNPQGRPHSSRLFHLAALMAGICLTVGTVLGAGESGKKETKKESKSQQKSKSASEEKVLITGSLIPQKVKPNRIPVTASNVIIIGQKEIERSGASSVAEVLRRQGASR